MATMRKQIQPIRPRLSRIEFFRLHAGELFEALFHAPRPRGAYIDSAVGRFSYRPDALGKPDLIGKTSEFQVRQGSGVPFISPARGERLFS
jgi:hypothetical protein